MPLSLTAIAMFFLNITDIMTDKLLRCLLKCKLLVSLISKEKN